MSIKTIDDTIRDYANIDSENFDFEKPANNEKLRQRGQIQEINTLVCDNDVTEENQNNILISDIRNENTEKFCKCSLKCSGKITREETCTIYKEFCALDTYTKQNKYLQSCIKSIPIKRRRRPGDPRTFYKQNTFIYSVRVDNTKCVRLCKTAFMRVHGLEKNRGRLNNILSMVKMNTSSEMIKKFDDEIKKFANNDSQVVPLYYACDLDELIKTGNLVTVYMVSLAQSNLES